MQKISLRNYTKKSVSMDVLTGVILCFIRIVWCVFIAWVFVHAFHVVSN